MSTNGLGSEMVHRDQLHLLSLEEKISLLSGISFTSTAGVKRLGIPSLKVRALEMPLSFAQSGICYSNTVSFNRSAIQSMVFAAHSRISMIPELHVFQAPPASRQHGTRV